MTILGIVGGIAPGCFAKVVGVVFCPGVVIGEIQRPLVPFEIVSHRRGERAQLRGKHGPLSEALATGVRHGSFLSL